MYVRAVSKLPYTCPMCGKPGKPRYNTHASRFLGCGVCAGTSTPDAVVHVALVKALRSSSVKRDVPTPISRTFFMSVLEVRMRPGFKMPEMVLMCGHVVRNRRIPSGGKVLCIECDTIHALLYPRPV